MRPRSILLVEDNPDEVELTQLAFQENGIQSPVTVLTNGADALDYLFCTGRFAGRNPQELPVLVLLDLNLPKVGGLEVLRRIRADARTRLLPVVVLSSSREERDLMESYRMGANSYVRKPVDFGAFQEVARQLGLYWLSLNEPPPPGVAS